MEKNDNVDEAVFWLQEEALPARIVHLTAQRAPQMVLM
jgi:hypothetical protein